MGYFRTYRYAKATERLPWFLDCLARRELLATQLHGFDKAKPKQLYRKFVETGGQLEIQADRLVVHFDKRAHNPILREAALDKACPPIPWLHNLPVAYTYP
jgi:hypothetical protein